LHPRLPASKAGGLAADLLSGPSSLVSADNVWGVVEPPTKLRRTAIGVTPTKAGRIVTPDPHWRLTKCFHLRGLVSEIARTGSFALSTRSAGPSEPKSARRRRCAALPHRSERSRQTVAAAAMLQGREPRLCEAAELPFGPTRQVDVSDGRPEGRRSDVHRDCHGQAQ
jgi:hypothetical protein